VASPNGLYNLSKLSVWWLRLGIAIERIKPGKPTQNARHERMHLTLKTETTRPPGINSLQQQARFDDFVQEFNHDRPHQALAMRTPAEIYRPASRIYRGLPEIEYPMHDRDVLVTACGRICMHKKKINISTVMAGQRLGLKEVDDGIWVVTFMAYDLGYIDLEQKTLQPIDNPSVPECHPCLRYNPLPMCPGRTEKSWRREWDSNPRYGCPYTRFPSVRLQPLGHPSAALAHGGRPALGQVGGEYRCGDRERKRIGARHGGAAPQGSAPPPAALGPQGLLAFSAPGGSRAGAAGLDPAAT
jgi:Integrase core domain